MFPCLEKDMHLFVLSGQCGPTNVQKITKLMKKKNIYMYDIFLVSPVCRTIPNFYSKNTDSNIYLNISANNPVTKDTNW